MHHEDAIREILWVVKEIRDLLAAKHATEIEQLTEKLKASETALQGAIKKEETPQ